MGSERAAGTSVSEEKEEKSLGSSTIRGAFWAYGSYVGGRVLVLISIALLARLLSPRDFGLVALALTFTTLLETVGDLGLGKALVVSKEDDIADRANTVFVYGLAIGLAGCLITIVCAPFVADFFREPAVLPLLIALSLNFPLRALGNTQYALAQKSMDFRTRTVAELANVVVRGLLGVILAVIGFGAWSLVLGYLAGTFVLSAMLWVMVPWKPRLRRANRAYARELFTFGGTLTGVDVLHGVSVSADSLIIGRVLGPVALGLYSLAQRLPSLLVVNLSVVAGTVLFPAYTKVEANRLGSVFLTSLRFTMIIAAPLAVGLAVMADPIILALFGDQWGGAVVPMQIMAVYGVILALEIPGGTIFKVTGRASILLKLAIPRTIMLYAVIAVVAYRGINAVAVALTLVTVLFAAIALVMASRVIGVKLITMVNTAWAPLIASAGAGVAMWGVMQGMSSPWPTIIVGAIVGGLVYLALLWFVARDALDYLLRKVVPSRA